jgi:beta-aspartyl-peptidase (threonine type)
MIMKKILTLLLLLLAAHAVSAQNKVVLVIHGGAGTILKENMTPELEKLYHAKLSEALDSGYAVIKRGGSSTDAVIASVKVLEDSPLFNAGKGAVYTNEGKHELDASIMNGKDRSCGAVAGVTNIKNPIEAARLVMEKSEHVMMAGKGAEEFAKKYGVKIVENSYFDTEERLKQLKQAQEEEKIGEGRAWKDYKFGTVGAVALDKAGNLSAGTSTGGMTNKRFGRVGDSPIIGAGTYADNAACGVSCTGHGEYFIKSGVARDIALLMQYKKKKVKQAAQIAIHQNLQQLGGTGGAIALDKNGNVAMEFNTAGMYRGYITEDGVKTTLIYK